MNILKWIPRVIYVIIAIIAIFLSLKISVMLQWGYVLSALSVVILFAIGYFCFELCLFLVNKLIQIYLKVYYNKIFPRIEAEIIDKYIQEHPIADDEEKKVSYEGDEAERLKIFSNYQDKLSKSYQEEKDKEEAIKLEKIKKYACLTLSPYGFTSNELSLICTCVESFVSYNQVNKELPLLIKKEGDKALLKQQDLRSFAWNIGYQYRKDGKLIARFVQYTFSEWFKGTEETTTAKKLRDVRAVGKIKLDEDILEHLDESKLNEIS